jgi:uncharacterized protein (DUF1778 family)
MSKQVKNQQDDLLVSQLEANRVRFELSDEKWKIFQTRLKAPVTPKPKLKTLLTAKQLPG